MTRRSAPARCSHRATRSTRRSARWEKLSGFVSRTPRAHRDGRARSTAPSRPWRARRTSPSVPRSPERARSSSRRTVSHLELALPDHPSNLPVEVGGQLVPVADLKAPLALDPGAVMLMRFLALRRLRVAHGNGRHSSQTAIPPNCCATRRAQSESPVPPTWQTSCSRSPELCATLRGGRFAFPTTRAHAGLAPATWIAAGVGTAEAGVRRRFRVLALSSNSRASSHCTGNDCDETESRSERGALHQCDGVDGRFRRRCGCTRRIALLLYVTTDHEAPSVRGRSARNAQRRSALRCTGVFDARRQARLGAPALARQDLAVGCCCLDPGHRLDRYELLCPIAQGGMASVWVARIQGVHGFEKIVAVKTILAEYATDPRVLKRCSSTRRG